MSLALTGATGRVGHFVLDAARAQGQVPRVLGRRAVAGLAHTPWALGAVPPLEGVETLVHCAFAHVPGRYRGGEGDDEAGFLRANLEGSVVLFEAARAAGVARVIFLSSRAVFDGYPPGTALDERLPPRPANAYGRAKAEAEAALAALSGPGFCGISLRATGVYGPPPPGLPDKWAQLFAEYHAGRPVAPRRGSEVHGADLARAIGLLATGPARPGAVHCADLVVDRHDLLAGAAARTGCPHPLPPRAQTPLSLLRCEKLKALGWAPGGAARLAAYLAHEAPLGAEGPCR